MSAAPLAGKNLLGSGMHAPATLRVPRRIASGYPPAMQEVIQHSEVEVHPHLVQDRLEPRVERLKVLWHHQGSPDGAQGLGRIRRPGRDQVARLRRHLGLLSLPLSLPSWCDTASDSRRTWVRDTFVGVPPLG